jgi:mono/diheme cytochrome c family protein
MTEVGVWMALKARVLISALVKEKTKRRIGMTKTIRSMSVLAVAVCLASVMSMAQSGGQATYKAKCAGCHGPAGTPSAGMAKMGVKSVSDPAIKALTVAQISTVVKSGKGKMKPIAGLTEAQIKDVAAFYKGLK